ncbi:MAG TPA: hypothetical protein PLE24_14480, partial [Chitinispirillaceae bacterium]|nr:hypothetical protein [Chitinispirillaceae bacterium]
MRDLSTELKGNTDQSMQDEAKQTESRYIIGIDLGTTNSAVSFVDLTRKPYGVEDFPVTQITAPGEIAALPLFPSFHYEAAEGEFSSGSLKLPWDTQDRKVITGAFARDHGALVPGRLVT